MEPRCDSCAFYFTKEDIKNLKIRVILQQLTGTQLVDASPRVVEGTAGGDLTLSNFIPLSTFSASSSERSNKQQQLIGWQQKILSASEVHEYSRSIYANNSKYKDWHAQANKLKKKKAWKKRIFTYIHEDDYQSRIHEPASTSEGLEPEILVRRRNNATVRRDSKDSIDHSEPTFKEKKKTEAKRDTTAEQQYFYIMADLAPPESLGDSRAYEVILCALRFNVRGLLTVTPDFSKPNTKPYRLESFGSDNALYEYSISHASHLRSAEEKKKDQQMTHQMERQRIEEIQQKVGSNWDDDYVKEGELRLIVNGEIARAHHFDEADKLYIHYMLHLPSGWKINKGSVCEGFTPACSMKYVDDVPTAHYSTPFVIDVTRSKSGRDWPVLLLGSFSIDWWDRDRDEGYAAFVLPIPDQEQNEGDHEKRNDVHSVLTWRPAQTSPFSKMRRYFLGGCQLLTDSSYLVVGANVKNGQASRLGFSTISSGVVELRTNSILQTGDADMNPSAIKGLHSSTWQLSTHAVLEAFQRSRQKLRAAKQGLI
ncbi:tectonic-like complex member MKS1 [Macrobrachium rosenbergii]|uniref:tectonic-like complex member MKS1 n=1 Tax=Macrobrachium rosenbergii TaxID=79674 RepID=UPI0034D64F21